MIDTVVWGTGNVGRAAIRAVDAHPGLRLAAVIVHNPDKVGRDAGVLRHGGDQAVAGGHERQLPPVGGWRGFAGVGCGEVVERDDVALALVVVQVAGGELVRLAVVAGHLHLQVGVVVEHPGDLFQNHVGRL